MKKKKKRRKKWLKGILLLLALGLLALIALYTPLFNIKDITVSGAVRYSEDEIRLASGILPGENGFQKLTFSPEAILGLRLYDAEAKIKSLPYVEQATVKLILPNHVKIGIVERQPAFYMVYLGNYLIMDAKGFVLEVSTEKPQNGLLELRGIHFTQYVIGKQLDTDNLDLINLGNVIMEAIKNSDAQSEFILWDVVNWVDIIDENTAFISLDQRVIVKFNPMDKPQYTIDFAKEIFFKKISTKERGRLEFSGNQSPSFIPE